MFKPVDPKQDFPLMEKKLLKKWYEEGIVEKYLQKNRNAKRRFSFLDGPITANNPMGVHHAWGRTYKDLWQRFYNLCGFKQRFQNGFDCQGLWVEVEVEKELGLKSKKEIENLVPGDKNASIAQFVQKCKDRVYRFSKIQTEQSKRLGYFMDWGNSYYTMSDENNYMIWYFLKVCYLHGWLYKGRESVPWCPRCETAISQHEILTEDYKEVVHQSVYFKLPLIGLKNEYLLVWTTTPWTIVANIAVAVDKKLNYSLVVVDQGEKFWLAKDLVKEVFKGKKAKILKTVKGKRLVGLRYKGPFDSLDRVAKVKRENPNKFHTVIATDQTILPISTEEGTGLVHTAVSAGVEDFRLGKKLGLPMIPVIDDQANYLPGLGFLSGKNAKLNPRLILDYLSEKGFAYKIHKYRHRYPVCWRCKTELVWKVTDEWYIAMDKRSRLRDKGQKLKTSQTLRQRMIEVAKKIKWIPKFGLERELDWLKNMDDWLISKKNRYWGLALPIWECNQCRFFEVIGGYEELKKRAVRGWDQFEGHSPHRPFIDQVKIKCSQCGGEASRILDVGNPWLDAGIVPFSSLIDPETKTLSYLADKRYFRTWFPADFITESFPGQFKNWFYSLIAMATVLEATNPFKTVLGFGTLLAEDGRPMHKSWGNAIEFNEGADKIGVDVMRWIYCRQNPADNLLFGYKYANEVRRQFYLRLWNVYRFFVEYANLDNIGPINKDLRPWEQNNVLDIWILNRFFWLVKLIKERLESYDCQTAALEIEKFVADLSTWYIRRSRKRVWIYSSDKKDKKMFYQTLYFILVRLAIVLSPFLPFITEEIYTNLTAGQSVHLSSWPADLDFEIDSRLLKEMELVRKIVEVGRRRRKELKIKLRQPLAKAVIELKEGFSSDFNEQFLKLIKEELNVKRVLLKTSQKGEKIGVVYDTTITKELKKEGQLRELIRKIQFQRKKMGLRPEERIILSIPKQFADQKEVIGRKVLAERIILAEQISVRKR